VRTLYWFPRVFAAVGATLLLVGAWRWSAEAQFAGRAQRAEGTVLSLEYRRNNDGGGAYYPVIQYLTASGDTIVYRGNAGCSPACHDVGEAVDVLYDPANPASARSATFFGQHIGSFVFGVLGLVFGGIGFTWLYIVRRNAARDEELRRTGRRIEVKVTEVERNTSVRVNNRHPWRVVCQWQDPGTQEVHVFRSANIWYDPTEYVKESVGVFVDRNDPRRYLVDIEFLPKEHA